MYQKTCQIRYRQGLLCISWTISSNVQGRETWNPRVPTSPVCTKVEECIIKVLKWHCLKPYSINSYISSEEKDPTPWERKHATVLFTLRQCNRKLQQLIRGHVLCTWGCTSCQARFGCSRWIGQPQYWSWCPQTEVVEKNVINIKNYPHTFIPNWSSANFNPF